MSYSEDDFDAPKDHWTRWWSPDGSSQWVCTDCLCSREPEQIEALLGKPVEVWTPESRTVISPLVDPENVPPAARQYPHYTNWEAFRSAMDAARQAARREEGLETIDAGPPEPFNPRFPDNGLVPSVTCEACIRSAVRPPVSRAVRAETLRASGWVNWEAWADVWVCPPCFGSRSGAELADLLGAPRAVTTQRARLYGPFFNQVFAEREVEGHYRSLADFETAIAAEQALTQIDDPHATDVPEKGAMNRSTAPYFASDLTTEEAARRFSGVHIMGQLGKGATSIVFTVRDHDGEERALKVLDPELFEDPMHNERFRREAEMMLDLDHPNIVKLYRHDEDTYIHMYLMEKIEGVTLRDAIKGGRLSTRKALLYTEQICAGLDYAHRRGLVHRDIKPDNIFIRASDEMIKIGDFGIAKRDGARTMTQQGRHLGTPSYIAPEQREAAHEVDLRADIYSLGVVMYEMLTGERPVLEPGTGRPILESVDPRIDPVFRKAMSLAPAGRYRSADVMRKAIVAVRVGLD